MPTQDTCQPEVIAALQKDGCIIIGQQVHIPKPDLYIFIDIEAAKEDQQAFIEVKCFPEANSTTEFYIAIGQYLLYRQVITTQKPDATLYLAIPEHIFNTFGETYRDTLSDNHVKMIVVNIQMEVIAQWIE